MKILTYNQLKKWEPCCNWLPEFKEKYGKSASMIEIEKKLLKREAFSEASWLIGKRLEKLNKRKVCAFAYRCSHRALKYARKEDVAVLEKAISFAKIFADTGKVDKEAAWSAARSAARSAWSAESAESAAWSAESAARSARSARSAARSAAWAAWSAESAESAESAARSAESAARSAELKWQFSQLNDIEDNWKGRA